MTAFAFLLGFAACYVLGIVCEITEELKHRRQNMKRCNRIHTFSRWPSDPRKRRDLAKLDLDFVLALHRCGIDTTDDPRLMLLYHTAEDQLFLAERELQGKG